jgi:hypothetical protein
MDNASLTRQQALEMPAGREMDRLVAIHVLGWVKPRLLEHRRGDHRLQPPDSKQWLEPLNYSTDISAAWAVVEHLRERFGAVSLHGQKDAFGHADEPHYFGCSVGRDDEEFQVYVSEATAEVAICKAALLAALGL